MNGPKQSLTGSQSRVEELLEQLLLETRRTNSLLGELVLTLAEGEEEDPEDQVVARYLDGTPVDPSRR